MKVNVIGVPIYFGCDIKGVELSPKVLRENGLIDIIKKYNHDVTDLGDIVINNVDENQKYSSNIKMKYIDEIINANKILARKVSESLAQGAFPFIIGGDHSLGLGTIAGASKYLFNLSVVWIDAHGDINTYETSPTGNVHGMPLAASMGIGHKDLINLYYEGVKVCSDNVFILGARDLDVPELNLIEDLKLNVWSMQSMKNKGIPFTMDDLLNKLSLVHAKDIHLSFDIDCLDKNLVPGTGTPVKDGLSVEESKYILKILLESGLVKSMDFVELNTILDNKHKTLNIALELIDWIFKCLK